MSHHTTFTGPLGGGFAFNFHVGDNTSDNAANSALPPLTSTPSSEGAARSQINYSRAQITQEDGYPSSQFTPLHYSETVLARSKRQFDVAFGAIDSVEQPHATRRDSLGPTAAPQDLGLLHRSLESDRLIDTVQPPKRPKLTPAMEINGVASFTVASQFMKRLGEFARANDKNSGAASGGPSECAVQVYFYASVARTLWRAMQPATCLGIEWRWNLAEMDFNSPEEGQKLLFEARLYFDTVHGAGQFFTGTVASPMSAKSSIRTTQLKRQLFDLLLNKAKNHEHALVYDQTPVNLLFEIHKTIENPSTLCDDAAEIVCLARLLDPASDFFLVPSFNLNDFAQASSTQLIEDGFIQARFPPSDDMIAPAAKYSRPIDYQLFFKRWENAIGGLSLGEHHDDNVQQDSSRIDQRGGASNDSQVFSPVTYVSNPPANPAQSVAQHSTAGPVGLSTDSPFLKGLGPMLPKAPRPLSECATAYDALFRHKVRPRLEIGESPEQQAADLADVITHSSFHQNELFEALSRAPDDLTTANKATEAFQKMLVDFTPDCAPSELLWAVAEKTFAVLIDLHADGTLLLDRERKQITARSDAANHKNDLEMNVKDRLEAIKHAYQQSKRIAVDCCTDPSKIHRLAWGPTVYQLMKALHYDSNKTKAESKKATDQSLGITPGKKRKGKEMK